VPPASFDESYYKKYYPDYDLKNTPCKLAYYRDTLARFLPPEAAHPKILDLGCAFGQFVAALDPLWQAYGTDVSEFAVGHAKKLVPRGTFAVMRDGVIPFSERFAAVTAWDVLEHIPDLDRTAADVREHLVERGVFAFAVPVYDGPLGRLVNRLDRDVTHINRFPRRFWLEWARRHFEIDYWSGAFRYLLPGGYYIHWTSHTLRHVSPAVVVIARQRAAEQTPTASEGGASAVQRGS
jgi:SAM-dependent methyltransferase